MGLERRLVKLQSYACHSSEYGVALARDQLSLFIFVRPTVTPLLRGLSDSFRHFSIGAGKKAMRVDGLGPPRRLPDRGRIASTS